MPFRRLILLTLAIAIPQVGRAQFTTFIPPRAKAADSIKATAAVAQKAKTDSAVNAQLTNMKTWVDSAAGVVAPPIAATDTAAAPPTVPVAAADPTIPVAGTRAPATASNLPLIALTGFGLLVAGTILVGGARPARQRA